MTGLTLQVRFQDWDLPPRILAELGQADTTPLMREIGDFVRSETWRNFDEQQTPEGQRWKPSQRALREGGTTLREYGILRDSYTYDARRDQVEIGSNVIYAAIHHYGGETGRNHATKIDPRPALGLTSEMEADIGDMALDFYRGLLA